LPVILAIASFLQRTNETSLFAVSGGKMIISAVRLLFLFVLIHSHANPLYKNEGNTTTSLLSTNKTSLNGTSSTDSASRYPILEDAEEDIVHNIYEWKIIAIRIGIGGACGFLFVAFFAILYCCFNRGSKKNLDIKGTPTDKEEGFENDFEPDCIPAMDGSRTSSSSGSAHMSKPKSNGRRR
ncbi:hypothetical protein V3C99_015900, partial [Haemonchus contortus]